MLSGDIRMEAGYDRIFPHSNASSGKPFFAWYGQIEGLGICLADRYGTVLTNDYYEHIVHSDSDERTAIGYHGNSFSLLDLETKTVKVLPILNIPEQ